MFMQLEYLSDKQLKKDIIEIIKRNLDTDEYRVFFFGSRVQGNASDRSDIDIGIDGVSRVPGHIMNHINEDINNLDTLYSFDIVDMKTATPEFRDSAMRYTESIL